MGRIRVLDEVVANQIAAGEVVERPASVAKELLENALDAKASAITVEVDGGGVERLRIVDNGHGMSLEDATLAFQRHATSKLTTASDLNHIGTLGFRGEALPSIASVSKVSVRTREPEALGASRIRIEGGKLLETTQAAGPVGTEFVVEDLFYNVPARRKFLKKPATESSHIQEAVQRLALCYPQVAFRLVKDGRTSLDFPRHDSLATRAAAVFGRRTCANLESFDVPGPFGLDGLFGPPDEARATARHYHTFINGRYVRDRVLMSAIQSAYSTRLPRGRHPFVVLRLRLPAEAVDVNVHPAKTEVRFVDTSAVHRLVARALGQAIEKAAWNQAGTDGRPGAAPVSTRPAGAGERGAQGGLDAHRRRIFEAMERLAADRLSKQTARPIASRPAGTDQLGLQMPRGSGTAPSGAPHQSTGFSTPFPQQNVPETPQAPRGFEPGLSQGFLGGPNITTSPPEMVAAKPAVEVSHFAGDGIRPFDQLTPLGAAGGLLWGRAADGLVGIHVGRATLALAIDALMAERVECHTLERPVRLELDRASTERLHAHRACYEEIGLGIEPFGGGTHVVERAPKCLDSARLEAAVTALIGLPAGEGADRLAVARLLGTYATPLDPETLVGALAKTSIEPGRSPGWCVRLDPRAVEQLLQ